MKNVKLDIAKTGIEISADIEAKAQAANALLHSGKGAGNDFLGWVHLPSSISENEIDAIRKEAAKLRSKADVVVCIGIGGSYLGAKAVLEAMSDPVQTPAQGAEGPHGHFRRTEHFGGLHRRTARRAEGAFDRRHRDFEVGHDDRAGHRVPPHKGRDREALRQEGGCGAHRGHHRQGARGVEDARHAGGIPRRSSFPTMWADASRC